MSDLNKQKPSKTNEEVDLIVFFNLIGNVFDKLFRHVGSIFKTLFSIIIYFIKILILKWKLIISILLIAFLVGSALEKKKQIVYSSSMLVRPYFDSKYQLINNIEYFNSLIGGQDYEALKNIFSINEEQVKSIKKFDITIGPENENDKLLEYEKFLKKLDSSQYKNLTFKEFVNNRTIYSGELFLITAESYRKNIFLSLEGGLNSSFSNKYSEKKKKTRDSLITLQKETIKANIQEVDSLQKVYIDVLKAEAGSKNATISIGGERVSSPKEKSNTREYELLNKQIQLRNELQKLDEEKLEDDVFFDVISSFQKLGKPVNKLTEKYSLIFPVLAFLGLLFIFTVTKVISFAKNYK